ncbi:hypothetical protein J6590_087992 [Homalodisca vitripennis]|nr:hypothetical protein J6590_087992 [Homalodisca vitripennis]
MSLGGTYTIIEVERRFAIERRMSLGGAYTIIEVERRFAIERRMSLGGAYTIIEVERRFAIERRMSLGGAYTIIEVERRFAIERRISLGGTYTIIEVERRFAIERRMSLRGFEGDFGIQSQRRAGVTDHALSLYSRDDPLLQLKMRFDSRFGSLGIFTIMRLKSGSTFKSNNTEKILSEIYLLKLVSD